MNQSLWYKYNWLNRIQSILLVVSMASVLGLTGWLIGGTFLATAVVGLVFVLYFVNPLISTQLIAKLYRCRPLNYSESPRLYQILREISYRAGLKSLPVLYLLPGNGMNAFATGTGENAAIAISKGLIQRLSINETAAILAHEVSHLRHEDTRIMSFANMISQLTYSMSAIGQFLLLFNLPLILFGGNTISWTAIFLLIMTPTINVLLQLALSRTREFRADFGAADLIGNPQLLASALSKIEHYQNGYFRHILWPAYKRVPEDELVRTHPPTKRRIQKLLEISEPKYTARKIKPPFSYPFNTTEKRTRLRNPLFHIL